MDYNLLHTLSENLGNNALSYEDRARILGKQPSLIIPSIRTGNIQDVKIGDALVFEEIEDGGLKSCTGLQNFIRLNPSDSPTIGLTTIFDNHHHALYFWLEAMRGGIITPGCELIHIDEHSDLWENTYTLDRERALKDADYAWEFVNYSCNVGNYIRPALDAGIIGTMIRIENEFELEKYIDYTPSENSILNLDLDFFAPEMDFIDEEKKLTCIQNLLPKVKCVTIATSPFFIDQGLALAKLNRIFEKFDHPMMLRN